MGTCTMHLQTGAANKQPPTPSILHSGGSKASSNVKEKASTPSSTSTTPKLDLLLKLGSDGKLTTIECKCCFDNKLCMFCKASGHAAKDCLKSTSRASKGCTVITTLETKLEVSLEAKK